MDIPDKIDMKLCMHGSGARGMAIYRYRDTGGLGVQMEAVRKDRRDHFRQTWTLDALPDQVYATSSDLQAAARELSPEKIAAIADGFPKIHGVERDPCSNRCVFCPRDAQPWFDADGHKIVYRTHQVTLADSWQEFDLFSVCDAHLAQFRDDPKGLHLARQAEVDQRKERARLRGFGGA